MQDQRPTVKEDNEAEPWPDTNHALGFTENNHQLPSSAVTKAYLK